MSFATQESYHSLPEGEYLPFKQRQELVRRLSEWFGNSYHFKVELMSERDFIVRTASPLNAIELGMEVTEYIEAGRSEIYTPPQPVIPTYR